MLDFILILEKFGFGFRHWTDLGTLICKSFCPPTGGRIVEGACVLSPFRVSKSIVITYKVLYENSCNK